MVAARRVADWVGFLEDGICYPKITLEKCSLHLSPHHESCLSSRPDLRRGGSKPCKICNESTGILAKTSKGLNNKRHEFGTISMSQSSVTSSFLLRCSFRCTKGPLTSGLNI